MEKKMLLAIALSIAVLTSWSLFISKTYHADNKGVIDTNTSIVTAATSPSSTVALGTSSVAAMAKPDIDQPTIKLVLENQEVYFLENDASIKEIVYNHYQKSKFILRKGLFINSPDLVFHQGQITPNSITFIHKDLNKEIIKRFIFSNSNYTLRLEIETHNLGSEDLKNHLEVVLGELALNNADPNARYEDVTIGSKEKTIHNNGRKDAQFADLKFLGLRDRYFCAIGSAESGQQSGFIKKIGPDSSTVGLFTPEFSLGANQRNVQSYNIYLGPQDLRTITKINADWTAIIYYGTFDIISNVLYQILEVIYKVVRNWGLAIIILSLLIYLILYPLTLKQMRSMKEMQAIQPKIEQLRNTYKDNPQRLNKEIMELYKEHKVNPLGGCLPMLLQIPIFFALYQVLARTIVLKGAGFLWIKDLSEPDRLIVLSNNLPLIGSDINILPILMAIGMFFQQKSTMMSSSSGSAEQQKIMLIIFPIMFAFIFYKMPSGLVLYWFINSALMLINQIRIQTAK